MERTDFDQWKAREVARLLALVESQRRYYQEVVVLLPVALVVLSADRQVISANRSFCRMFGLRNEDLQRKSIDQIVPSAELIERIAEAHLDGPARPPFRVQIDHRSLRIAMVPMRSWDNESELEILMVVEELEATGPASAAAMPAGDAPVVLWQADASTLAFTSVSGEAHPLLGYPVSHWLHTPGFFRQRIHPEDRASTMRCYEGAFRDGGDASAEYRAVSASGGLTWCRETIRVPARAGASRTITGVITDISRRKIMEDQLLTAERSDALQVLASRLSHDLNNPLMIIAGYAEEMLQGIKTEDPLRADVQQILAATERISRITSQLVEFTRRVANPPQRMDLGRALAGLKDRIARAAGESAAVELPASGAGTVWAMADPVQFEDAILAIVSIPSPAARRLKITCDVESITEQLSRATLGAGKYARVTIHDDGYRMDEARRRALFEAALAPKDPATSPGPALARAYATVREWGGDIACTSELSGGSSFIVYLPYCEPEVPARTAAIPTAPAASPADKTRQTILVVEDEAGIRALLRKILGREQYHVLDAGSGEEARTVLAAHPGPVDLLLTDVMLPGMRGRDVAVELRKTMPELKVLYVSGYTDDETVRAGAFPPGSKFLQKPFTLAALLSKVREALES